MVRTGADHSGQCVVRGAVPATGQGALLVQRCITLPAVIKHGDAGPGSHMGVPEEKKCFSHKVQGSAGHFHALLRVWVCTVMCTHTA